MVGSRSLLARASVVGAALSLLLTPLAPVLAQSPSLAGETLNDIRAADGPTLPPPVTTTFDCEPEPGGNSVFTYEAEGIAAGPYPGTFHESGRIVIGPMTEVFPDGQRYGNVIEWDATFTINSADAVITGSKVVDERDSDPSFPASTDAFCYRAEDPNPEHPELEGNRLYASSFLQYESTITTPTGTHADSGLSYANIHELTGRNNPADDFAAFSEWYIAPVRLPAAITLTPPAAVNQVGTEHTVTGTVRDAVGAAVPGVTVVFTTTGSTSISGSCTTDSAGQCDFTYTGPQLSGADVITGCADSNSNGAADPGEPCGEAVKAWESPVTTPGHVTGGGYILDPSDGEKVSFGFNAKSDDKGVKGNCTVVDAGPARNIKIKCLDVTSLVQSGTHATFFGRAEVNGVLTDYRIDVDDLGEPGRGRDTFKIVTGTGYSAAGILDGGNIKIHKAQ